MTFLLRSKSGVYYYRKTFVADSGKRKEFKKSLKTSDYKLAQFLALKLYFNVAPDREIVGVISDQQAGEKIACISQSKPELLLKTAITNFFVEKRRTAHWCEKEYRRGEVMLEALGKLLGSVSVVAVGRKEANQFKQSLLDTDRSITTINNYLKRASMLFTWLEQCGECSSNPFKGLLIKQRRNAAELREAYSDVDKTAYLQFAHTQQEWRKWVLLLLRYTGARPSEICQLYKEDIDLEDSTITIHASRPDQKLKTPSSARTIPIHSKLLEAGLVAYVEGCAQPRLFPVLNNLPKGGYSHTFVTWFSKQRAKVEGLPELYGARHTAATEMKNAGIPNQYASAVLGHSNNSITYDRYGKCVEVQWLSEAVESIGNTTKTKKE